MRRRKKIATAAMISATPIDMEIIAAVLGLCFGTRDRTQIVSIVAGTDPAAKSPATRQSTLPFLEWMRCQPFSSPRRKVGRFHLVTRIRSVIRDEQPRK